jgi:peptide/nickel transport system ATP-binding protein
MTLLPPGCSFASRCRYADARCGLELPQEFALASDHMVRCLRVAEGEIAVAPPKLGELAVW